MKLRDFATSCGFAGNPDRIVWADKDRLALRVYDAIEAGFPALTDEQKADLYARTVDLLDDEYADGEDYSITPNQFIALLQRAGSPA